MTGKIVKALSGFYYVNNGNTVYECRARGNFRKSGISPLVGDTAEFEPLPDNTGTVTAINQRKSFLLRPPVANIDRLFIVSAHDNPSPNTFLIDKITAIALWSGIEPVVVFNKCDVGDFEELRRIYSSIPFLTLTVSAKTGEGLDRLREELKGRTSAFTGNSGVGKSSILNALYPNLALPTGNISEKLGRGKHTTRHTELFSLPQGGYVADTPGFSSVGYEGFEYDFKEKLVQSFPDIDAYSDNCRFSSCTHTCEKGCNVIKAINDGLINESRHNSYVALFNEFKEFKPWNTAKRK